MKRKDLERTRCQPGSSAQAGRSAPDLEPGGPGGQASRSDTRVRHAGVWTHPITPRTRQTEGHREQQRNCCYPAPAGEALLPTADLQTATLSLLRPHRGVLEMWEGGGTLGWHSERVFSIVGFIITQVCGVQEIRKPAFERMVCYSGPRRGHRGGGHAGKHQVCQEVQGESSEG